MFIKILTPNHNGKIELTTRDLEALIQEAVDKAIREDRANRPYWSTITGTSQLNSPLTIDAKDSITFSSATGKTNAETQTTVATNVY